jgi:hypothetical protein
MNHEFVYYPNSTQPTIKGIGGTGGGPTQDLACKPSFILILLSVFALFV